MKKLLMVMLLVLSGCAGPSYDLDDKWLPLENITEFDLPFVSDTATTTIGETMYTIDLEDWLKRFPPNSPRFNALLAHEQVHSIRQADQGLFSWLFDYLSDDEFKWNEEKLGWEQEIRISRQFGIAKTDEAYATILSEKYQDMVTYQEALLWVRSIR